MDRFRGASRLLAIAAAVILAGVAAAALFLYVRGIEQRAFRDAERVEVLVADGEIPAGTTGREAGEAGLIVPGTMARESVPEGALTSPAQISDLVTQSTIFAGEVIIQERFTDAGEAARRLEIPEGFEAISVEVSIPEGVAGFVREGDQVSLIATLGSTEDDDQEDTTEVQRAQYLLQDVAVLSTGQRAANGGDTVQEGGSQVMLTLALEPEDAERLVLAINEAELYFTLLPPDAEPDGTPGVTIDDLFS